MKTILALSASLTLSSCAIKTPKAQPAVNPDAVSDGLERQGVTIQSIAQGLQRQTLTLDQALALAKELQRKP